MLILASASRTRKTLLEQAGLSFEAISPEVDERALEAGGELLEPSLLAQRLAEQKALSVSAGNEDALVIGADQILALDGNILHKPESSAGVAQRLEALRGRTHSLHCGAALARDGALLWSMVDSAELTMRSFSTHERDRVLELEGPALLQSVGGYRLEGASIQLFENIRGDYFTILGLPLLPLIGALRRISAQDLAL